MRRARTWRGPRRVRAPDERRVPPATARARRTGPRPASGLLDQLTSRVLPFQYGSRSLNFWIFPVAVRGITGRNSTVVGDL